MPAKKKTSSAEFMKYLPFLLPILAIVVMIFLAWRWYAMQTKTPVVTPATSPKIEIENLGNDDQALLTQLTQGQGDYQTVKMIVANATETVGAATLRYDVQDEVTLVSVFADLEALKTGENYQVWLNPVGTDEWQPSDLLTLQKAGYIASLAVKTEALPMGVKITRENSALGSSIDLFTGEVIVEKDN